MILSRNKRNLPRCLSAYILFLPFFFATFIELLGLPGAVRYSVDVAWCTLILLAIGRGRLRFHRRLVPMALTVGAFLLYSALLLAFRYQSGVWYLWGIRNYFRFYAAFFAFSVCFEERDAERCFQVLEWLFWINFAAALVQFFFLGHRQDYLGGIFGVDRGRNGTFMLPFFALMLTRSLLSMLEGTESTGRCFCKCGAALLVAALAEMFGFFLFFGLMVFLAALLTRPSLRKALLFAAVAVGIFLCSGLLLRLFGEGSELTLDVIRSRLFAAHYATDEDLGRLTAIPTLSRTILTEPWEQLFGLGLGNCDTSTFSICNSEFYQQHARLHYTWFLSAFLFLETGWVGLGLYLLFFLVCLVSAAKQSRQGGNRLYCRMGIILSLICMVLTVYNAALRAEGAYILYFALALPFLRRPGEGKDGMP